MKKIVIYLTLIISALGLISWGRTGHSTIGLIAERHLTPEAKAAVNVLLNGQSLADIASWADDNRDRATAPWHFINVPLGLSFDDFKSQIENAAPNVYTALLGQETILADTGKSNAERATALKYIVHFAGDIHQPMHVSRAEDKGGNTIQLRYDGQGTNLHSLWDTKMLEHAGLNAQQLADQFDQATPAQIAKWQNDPQITWAWESYQISTQLYAEIDTLQNKTIDDTYYQKHLPIIENRIEKAGVRLAGILNALFAKSTVQASTAAVPTAETETVTTIPLSEAANHIDQTFKTCGKVYGHKDFGSMVLVNIGAAYPNQLLTVVLRGDARKLQDDLDDQDICVTGKLILYKGKPEIVVNDSAQISK
ncbi:MAG: S1/P1 nuclease [Mucilaginibacter sp.]|nr:S1/P1 nuclease [Mucilaginibacter sp.]